MPRRSHRWEQRQLGRWTRHTHAFPVRLPRISQREKMDSEICSQNEPQVTVGTATLALLNQLARAQNTAEAQKLASSLRDVLDASTQPEILNLVSALEERAVALELQKRLAGRDELTGVANRRGFNEALHREVARSRRSGKPLSLLMLDMDGLKQINDRFGHPAGDTAIGAVAQAALAAVRDADQVFRLGGDEFAVILPEAEGDEAAIVGERIRRKLRDRPVHGLPVEVSFGHARLPGSDMGENDCDNEVDCQQLIQHADRALYHNKRARRAV